MTQQDNRTYTSERGFSLLYTHKVGEAIDVPVLTLENYTKWYNIYLVMPDGVVQMVDAGVIDRVMHDHLDAQWVDHLFHPRLLWRLAKHLGAELDERTHEVALGRWMLESGQLTDVCERHNFYPVE